MIYSTIFLLYFVAGYIIPKGWAVPIWNRGVHMDPEIYQNPLEFDPSRWDVCFKISINSFYLLLFSF